MVITHDGFTLLFYTSYVDFISHCKTTQPFQFSNGRTSGAYFRTVAAHHWRRLPASVSILFHGMSCYIFLTKDLRDVRWNDVPLLLEKDQSSTEDTRFRNISREVRGINKGRNVLKIFFFSYAAMSMTTTSCQETLLVPNSHLIQ